MDNQAGGWLDWTEKDFEDDWEVTKRLNFK